MKTLSLWFACASLLLPATGAGQTVQSRLVSTADERHSSGDIGYFFSLRDVPLSQKHYIFLADPLKKAVFVDGEKNVLLSHTMTVKNGRGFDMYFSATNYNITLAVKEAKQIDEGTIEYKGTLLIRHGAEKHKLAVHGFQNR